MIDTAKSPLTLNDLRTQRNEILRLAEKYGATNVRVFGSIARGEATADSDVDLLVTFHHPVSLFDRAGLLLDLQELLNRRVDVVDDSAIKARYQSKILQDSVAL